MKTLSWTLTACATIWLMTAQAQEPAPKPQADPVAAPQADLDKLQGSWQCVSWISNGLEGGRNPEVIRSSYDGNRLTLWNEDEEYRHSLVTLDPGRTPKAMNVWDLDGPGADRTNQGIYELNGDTLKLCLVLGSDEPRPKEFTSEPGSNHLLLTYKRRKP